MLLLYRSRAWVYCSARLLSKEIKACLITSGKGAGFIPEKIIYFRLFKKLLFRVKRGGIMIRGINQTIYGRFLKRKNLTITLKFLMDNGELSGFDGFHFSGVIGQDDAIKVNTGGKGRRREGSHLDARRLLIGDVRNQFGLFIPNFELDLS